LGGDEARVIAGEEEYSRRDVIWFTQSAYERSTHGGLDHLGRKAEIKSVRIKPGQMALTLMPWDLRSSATRFVRPMIAALLTAYGVVFAAVEPIPAVEDKLIIFPYRRSIIFGITA
jgi:hypothetical protein